MGLGEQWQELSWLSYTSEINFLTGLGDICISKWRSGCPFSRTRLIQPPLPFFQVTELAYHEQPHATRATETEVLYALWAIRVALVVATLYIVVGFGLTLAAWITGGLALILYGILFIKVQEAQGAKAVGSRGLIFSVAYVSVVNFVLGLPYRTGPGTKIFWAFQLLASTVALGLILGYAFSVPEIQAAYGCYSKIPFYELGRSGICPQSTPGKFPVPGSHAVCQNSVGAVPIGSACETLPWAATIGTSVLHVARSILAVALGIYAATIERNYRQLTAL